MTPALLAGDHILVNKLLFGGRIFRNYDFVDTTFRPPYWRVPGFRQIRRNDVLVFNYPYSIKKKISIDINKFYVKRCVALPGDSFYIENGMYRVKGHVQPLGNVAAQMAMSHTIDSSIDPKAFKCFPKKTPYRWTIKNFGPLYVPRKGDRIRIDTLNVQLYRQLISWETQLKTEIKHGKVLLNGKWLRSYTFKTNYYFMAGDNVPDSRDSRYWGLLPEDHIVGVATLIWKSADPEDGAIRWHRVCKSISSY